MDFIITNKAFARNVCEHIISQLYDGKEYELSFNEIRKNKTNQQRKYIFAIFEAVSKYFVSLGYQFLTKEAVKDWIYSELAVNENIYLPNGKNFIARRSLSSMTVQEASHFISKLLIFIETSEVLEGFTLPPYLRYCWTKHITIEDIENAYKRKLPQKSAQFLKYQRSLTCLRCGRRAGEVHHIKEGSGLGRKNPDWFSIPICPECHVPYLHSKVGEDDFLKEIAPTINNLDIETFCRINFLRWYDNKD